MTTFSIHKYTLNPMAQHQVLSMPVGAVILSVHVQKGLPCLWARVPFGGDLNHTTRNISICMTGEVITMGPLESLESLKFLGTYLLHDGVVVQHVFESTNCAWATWALS